MDVVSYAAVHYRIASLEATETSCAAAEAVVRSFYSQEIGSSGATVAEGLGCAYGSNGRTVECRSSSGSGYDGPVGVRWEEDAPAAARAQVDSCRPFTISKGRSQGDLYALRASAVRRASRIRCGVTRKLLKAAYKTGSLKVVRTIYHPPSGRPTYWLRGGWRCGNGAGGAACWNVRGQGLNPIPIDGLSHGMAVTASTRVVRLGR
jgi:hypothetical protein